MYLAFWLAEIYLTGRSSLSTANTLLSDTDKPLLETATAEADGVGTE